MSKTLEGMARHDHLMHRMFVEYNRHLADCMHDKKSVGDRDREDAMAKAVQFLADNVSDEMVFHLIGDTFKHRPPAFKFEYTVEQTRSAIAAALRAAAGGGEK